jgi:hypothetical protein
VTDAREFQQRIQQIDERLRQLEAVADPAVRSAAQDLVKQLMDIHGSALERMLEIVFESKPNGPRTIDELGSDPLVSSLLILYGFHPDDLETRVGRKLDQLRSQLFKLGAEAEVIGVVDGQVRLRVSIAGHACGSTSGTVRSLLEGAIFEAAPDLTSLTVEGLDDPKPAGFVSVEALLGPVAGARSSTQPIVPGDAMD